MGGRILRLKLLGLNATVDCDLRGAFGDLSDIFCNFALANDPSVPVDAAFAVRISDETGELVLTCNNRPVLETLSYPYLLACLENEIIGRAVSGTREHLVLHAMATASDGKGILFPGPKRVGKSTLGAFLVSSGHQFYADDAAAIELDTVRLVPLCLPFHLKGSTEGLLRSQCPGLTVRSYGPDPSDYPARYALPPRELSPRRPHGVDLVIFPRYTAGEAAVAVELGQAEAALDIIGHALNFDQLGARAFAAVAALARRVRFFRLVYSDLADARSTVDDLCRG
jgi:hypothetical protein